MKNNFFLSHFTYLEWGFLGLAGLCFALRLYGWLWAEHALLLGLSGLALGYVAYTLAGLAYVPTGASRVIFVLVGLDCALATQATALKLGLLAGSDTLFRWALWAFLGLVMAVLIQLWLAERSDIFRFYVGLLRRNLLIVALGFLFFLTPYSRLIRLYHPTDAAKQNKLLKELVPQQTTNR